MKTRTTSHGVSGPSTFAGGIFLPNGTQESTSAGSVALIDLGSSSESIATSATKLMGVRSCDHTKISNKLFECKLNGRMWFSNRSRYATLTGGLYRLWEYYQRPQDFSESTLVVEFSKSVEQLKAQALHEFYNDNEVDNLLNILEFGQVLSGVKGVFSFLQRSGTPRLKLLDFSNQYLAYQFGFAPLVSDMKKTYEGFRKVRADLRRFNSNPSMLQHVVKKCIGTFADTRGYPDPQSASWTSGYASRIYATCPPTRIVGVSGRKRHIMSPGLLRDLDYLLGRYLSSGPANLAWQTLRFSFVLDWFVDTTNVIDRFDQAVTGGSKQIDYCWTSEKFEARIPTYFKNISGWYEYEDYEGGQVMDSELSFYHRKPLVPDLVVVPSGRFGKKQASLLLALFHQLVANLRR